MKKLYKSKEAANYLGFSDQSMRLSRKTGLLAGRKAPKFLKIGRSVRYDINALNDWVNGVYATNNQKQLPLISDQNQNTKKTKNDKRINSIFEYWCSIMGKDAKVSKLTKKRRAAIGGRLKDGYTVDQIKVAIIGCAKDPFYMGQNDRNKAYNDIELICRTGEKLEYFIDSAEKKAAALSKVTLRNIYNTQGGW